MSEIREETGRAPEDGFRDLRERPTPELDSGRLWRRIEARLTPRSTSLWMRLFGGAAQPRPVLRWAGALAAVALVALAVWMATAVLQSSNGQLVLLAGEPDSAAAPAEGAAAVLELRLVRGYDGATPDDVRSAQALGVGGADPLRDVRERIAALLPFADFGIVGAWQGPVEDGRPLSAELSGGYRLSARTVSGGGGSPVRLESIELSGGDGETVSGDLSLEPGGLYILGVIEPGADESDLVLLVRVRSATQEPR